MSDRADELTEMSHRILDAIREKSADVLDAVLDDGFVHLFGPNGRQNKSAFIENVTQAAYTITEMGFDWLHVETQGNVGVAVGVQRARGQLPKGEPFTSVGGFTDVFRRTDDGWRLCFVHSIELPEGSTS